MATELTTRPSVAVPGPLPGITNGDSANRLVVAHIWVAVIAFGVAAGMAMMQAISRASLESIAAISPAQGPVEAPARDAALPP
jgi:hypothetical protein